MAKQPAILLYTGDWLKDPALSRCTSATRGVWIDLISAMHESGREGVLCGTNEQLARVARCSPAELALALTDLLTTGAADVTERNGIVTVINRRMQREHLQRVKTHERVKKHRCNAPSSSSASAEDTPQPPNGSDAAELPPSLANDAFREAWGDWCSHRLEIRKPLTRTAIKLQLKKCAKWGSKKSIDTIHMAIEKGWQGLWPKDDPLETPGFTADELDQRMGVSE